MYTFVGNMAKIHTDFHLNSYWLFIYQKHPLLKQTTEYWLKQTHRSMNDTWQFWSGWGRITQKLAFKGCYILPRLVTNTLTISIQQTSTAHKNQAFPAVSSQLTKSLGWDMITEDVHWDHPTAAQRHTAAPSVNISSLCQCVVAESPSFLRQTLRRSC